MKMTNQIMTEIKRLFRFWFRFMKLVSISWKYSHHCWKRECNAEIFHVKII